MNFLLKGITKASTVEQTQMPYVVGYDFDLRPKSFNFTQLSNIQEIVSQYPLCQYQLIFENEKAFLISEIIKKIDKNEKPLSLEICGNINFEEIDELELDYSWRFQEESKFSDIKLAKNLKKIIISHKSLELYLESGELFGFLNLFNDDHFKKITFELLLDWDSNIIESALDNLDFSFVSFELNSKVELSYQNPDLELIKSELQRYNSLFN